ncbi:DNA excision repair protein ERCC-6-like [Branchiostoma lanceolatum]|uniref:DNA excision repair protein ERCC-6-like n=1 Tax=Branchiostoma lanceolatum TaxID=7740 RepID=UPI0034570E58
MSIHGTAEAVGRMRLEEGDGAKPGPSGMGMLDASSKALFNKLIMRAKQEQEKGNLQKALQKFREAQKLYPTEKVKKKITKIEAFLMLSDEEEQEEEDQDDGMVLVSEGFRLPKHVYNKLYPYQQDAVKWFHRLAVKGKGGILGDDMGLGKTVQVTAFLYGMFLQGKIHSVLIVLPVALITNWERELEKWAGGEIRVKLFHGSNSRERTRNLERVQRKGGVVLTSYGMVANNWEQVAKIDYKEFVWDYVILDEGHKIKNPTKTTKACHAIPARNRFILTGTPIQNNLREMWSLFDFVSQGTLLGTAKTFKMEYENPITRAREKDATAGEIHLGNKMSESLRHIIDPYFLRRTKGEVMPTDKENTDPNEGARADQEQASGNSFPSLERKNDLILWVILSQAQQQIYKDFLSLDRVKELLMTTRSPLAELNVLKKICDHPRLLSTMACAQLGLDGEDGMDPDEDNMAHEVAANSIENISTEQLMAESGKTCVLVELLERLKEEGHQTLVFSQSRKMLDIIQKILKSRGFKVMRVDGTITKLEDRDKRIRRFQNDPSWSVFLLTTQVGGVGLNLTAADRVVIYDPSWNPATDAQAVDRAYRIGQKKAVVIYRFITCGSVEEKIYRRQVFKESVTRQTTGACKDPFRYFSRQDLRELFVMDNPEHSTTQEQLAQMHSQNRKSDTTLDEHIAYLLSLGIFGISDHDLLYTKQADHEELPEGQDYIQQRVHKARELVMAESQLHHQMNELRQTTTEASFMRRHGGKQPGQDPGAAGPREGFPDNLPELFHPSQDDQPRNMPNKPRAKTVSSDDYSDSPAHPASIPVDLPGQFIDLRQETEEEQAQKLEKSFAKISISSQEKDDEEEEQELSNSLTEDEQEDAEDEQLQMALAMSLQDNHHQSHETLTREPLTNVTNISKGKDEGNVSKRGDAFTEDSIVSVDDDRATPGLNRALFTSSDSLLFVADSGDEDTSRVQQDSRPSSRAASRGDVFVIEDSESEESGSDDDVPVVSAIGPAREAIVDVSEEEEKRVVNEKSFHETNTIEWEQQETTAAVAMETQHPDDEGSEEGMEAEEDSQHLQHDNPHLQEDDSRQRSAAAAVVDDDEDDDSEEESEPANIINQHPRQTDRKSFPSMPEVHNRSSLDDSLIKSARRRPRPRVIDSDSEDDGNSNRNESSAEVHHSHGRSDRSAEDEQSLEDGNKSSLASSPGKIRNKQRAEVPSGSEEEEQEDEEDSFTVDDEEEDSGRSVKRSNQRARILSGSDQEEQEEPEDGDEGDSFIVDDEEEDSRHSVIRSRKRAPILSGSEEEEQEDEEDSFIVDDEEEDSGRSVKRSNKRATILSGSEEEEQEDEEDSFIVDDEEEEDSGRSVKRSNKRATILSGSELEEQEEKQQGPEDEADENSFMIEDDDEDSGGSVKRSNKKAAVLSEEEEVEEEEQEEPENGVDKEDSLITDDEDDSGHSVKKTNKRPTFLSGSEDEPEEQENEEDSLDDEQDSDPRDAVSVTDDEDGTSDLKDISAHEEQGEEAESSEMEEEEYYSPGEESLLEEAPQPDLVYRDLVKEGRKLEAEGQLNDALEHYLQALEMDATDMALQMTTLKLAQKVHKAKK